MAMTQHSLLSLGPTGFHRIAYTDRGARDSSHVAICVHGLSRNSRDFDFLARALQPSCRVVCMDVVGRGDSEWLNDVGPLVPWQGLLRLGGHLAPAKPFATREEAAAHLRAACSNFGLDSEAQWEHMLGNSIEQGPDGFVLRYDPALAAPRRSADPGPPMGLNFA